MPPETPTGGDDPPPHDGRVPPRIAVEVLGPVRLLVDGTEVDVGGPRPRALLAALALRAGRPVPVPDLVAAVWGDGAPPTATATLRAYVSRLRREVGDALRREAGGYALHAEVDADAFLADVRDAALGDPAGGDRPVPDPEPVLAAALARWRGPVAAGTPPAGPAAQDVARLDDAHVAAARAHARALGGGGRHDAAVDALRALARAHPHREDVAADLMLALHRAGRQQEALETYRRTRADVLERAGLEPGRALQDLHQRILAQDPTLTAARPGDDHPAHAGGSSPPVRVDRGTAEPGTVGRARADVGPGAADPPVRTSNLPLPLTSFIGRDADLAELADALDGHRLLTLTGPGGTGKTRLALEAARRRSDPDGPWLVELAAVEDPTFTAAAVAEALQLGVADGRTALELVAAALAGRATLLVLDNCEHLVDQAAAVVQHLLSTCPGLRVLATSREPLGVPGERVVPVGTLPVVERGPDLLAGSGDAMRLFVERARDVVGDLGSDGATMELIRRICQDLDGLPLAIELAAAELRTFSPTELEAELADRFAVLTGGPRTARPHQRTLQTTVAWSVDLLDAAQRDLFARLSVFVGGFTREAVRAVCGPAAAALLPDLVDRSLVEVDTSREPRRHRVLETLRQYGASLLDEATTRDLRERHAGWAADLAVEAGQHLRTHAGPAWERRLDAETGNLRAALRALLDAGDHRRALEVTAALWWWWFRRARLDEGRAWLGEVLARHGEGPAAGASPAGAARAGTVPADAVLAEAVYADAFLAFFAGDPAVEPLNDRAVDIARAAGDDAAVARMLTSKAYRWALFGRIGEARPVLEEGLAALPAAAPDWAVAECRFCAGQVARAAGSAEEALTHLRAALAAAERSGHRWLMTVARWVLAEHALDRDAPREAAPWLEEALELARADGDRAAVLGGLRSLAGVAARTGQPTLGAELLGAVGGLAGRIGMDVDHMERTDADRTAEVLRTALRPEALAAALARGEGQPIGVALRLAARILDGAAAA